VLCAVGGEVMVACLSGVVLEVFDFGLVLPWDYVVRDFVFC